MDIEVDKYSVSQSMGPDQNTFSNLLSTYQNGTVEIKNLIMNECKFHIICNACASVFNSSKNFICHKKWYCKSLPSVQTETVQIYEQLRKAVMDFYLTDAKNSLVEKESASGSTSRDEMSEDENSNNSFVKGKRRSPFNEQSEFEDIKLSFKTIYEHISMSIHGESACTDFEDSLQACLNVDIAEYMKNSKTKGGEEKAKDSPALQDRDGFLTRKERLQKRNDCLIDDFTFKCLTCDHSYANVKTLHNHMLTIHDGIRELSHCPHCDVKFQTKCGLNRHLKGSHNMTKEQIAKQKFKTTLVNFGESSNASTVQDSSSKPAKTEKPNDDTLYLCSSCGKSDFTNSDQLDKHHQSCNVEFKDIKPDIPFSHVSANGRPIRIGVKKTIGKEFVNSQTVNLRYPNRVIKVSPINRHPVKVDTPRVSDHHTRMDAKQMEEMVNLKINVKKRQCLICKKSFNSLSNVRRHVALHLGWTRYKCDICSNKGYNRADVRHHISKMHTDKDINDENVDDYISNMESISVNITQKIISKGKNAGPQSPKSTACDKPNKTTSKLKPVVSPKQKTVVSKSSSTSPVSIPKTVIKTSPYRIDTKLSHETRSTTNELSKLVTRSGMYQKEDRLNKINALTSKLQALAESRNSKSPSVSDKEIKLEEAQKACDAKPAQRERKDVQKTKSKKRAASSYLEVKANKIKIQRVGEFYQIERDTPSESLLYNSFDEGEKEERVSKRKQSLSKIRHEYDDEIHLGSVISPSKHNSRRPRSSSLTNFHDNGNISSPNRSKTNPNSPQAPSLSSSKIVISDEKGRFVKETYQTDLSPKKSPSKIIESVPAVQSMIAKAINFSDPNWPTNSRIHTTGLLRKYKNANIAGEKISGISAISEVLKKSTSEKTNAETMAKEALPKQDS